MATTTNQEDKELYDYVTSEGYLCEKGSENNVLERFAKASLKYKADVVIRITGDCPLVDPEIVDNVIKLFKKIMLIIAQTFFHQLFQMAWMLKYFHLQLYMKQI